MSVTWNPSDKAADLTLSNGDLTASNTTENTASVRAVGYAKASKWYCEITIDSIVTPDLITIGVATSDFVLTSLLGDSTDDHSLDGDGYTYYNGNGSHYATLEYTAGDIVSIAVDTVNEKLWYAVNGVWEGDPVAGTGAVHSPYNGAFWYPAVSLENGSELTANFGATAFSYTIPNGFSSFTDVLSEIAVLPATWNENTAYAATFEDAGLTMKSGNSISACVADITTGGSKYYWEYSAYIPDDSGIKHRFGIAPETYTPAEEEIGETANTYALGSDGDKYNNDVGTALCTIPSDADCVIGVAYDAGAGKLYYSVNGTWVGNADPVAGTNPAFTSIPSGYIPAFSGTQYSTFGLDRCTLVTLPEDLTYSSPTGYAPITGSNDNSGTMAGNIPTVGGNICEEGISTATISYEIPLPTGEIHGASKLCGEQISVEGEIVQYSIGTITGEILPVTGFCTASPASTMQVKIPSVVGNAITGSSLFTEALPCLGGMSASIGDLASVKIEIPICSGDLSVGAGISLECLPAIGAMAGTPGSLASLVGEFIPVIGTSVTGAITAGKVPRVQGNCTAIIPEVSSVQVSISPSYGAMQAGSAIYLETALMSGIMEASVGNLASMAGKFTAVKGNSYCGSTLNGGAPELEINWAISVGQVGKLLGRTPRIKGSMSADIPKVLTISSTSPLVNGNILTVQGTVITLSQSIKKPKGKITAISGEVWDLEYTLPFVTGNIVSKQENIATLLGECRILGQIICESSDYDGWVIKYRRP